jgi:hypothetical protein
MSRGAILTDSQRLRIVMAGGGQLSGARRLVALCRLLQCHRNHVRQVIAIASVSGAGFAVTSVTDELLGAG